MKFLLTIDLGNTTMQDNHDVAKALRAVADRLSKFVSTGWSPYAFDGKIMDDSGNAVGGWEVKPDVEWNPVVKQLKPSKPSSSKPSKRSRTP